MKKLFTLILIPVFFSLLTIPASAQTLLNAAAKGDLNAVEDFTNKGADLNKQVGGFGFTALIYAARNGHTEVVKFLIEKGADMDAAIAGLENSVAKYPKYADDAPKAGIKLLEGLRKK